VNDEENPENPFTLEPPVEPASLEAPTPLEEAAFEISPEPSPLPPLDEPMLLNELDTENPFNEPAPGELQALPAEFETPGVAAVLESATLAVSTPEELIEPDASIVASGAAPLDAAAPQTPLSQVGAYSDAVGVSEIKSSVPAAFPFSLSIEGKLGDYERAKFLDFFAREDMGIREIDLEPQLESGHILIPRISEYAGILLVQTLRNFPVKMRLGPAEEIYRKYESLDDPTAETLRPETVTTRYQASSRSSHPSYSPHSPHSFGVSSQRLPQGIPLEIPMTPDESLPQFSSFEVLDTIVVSATLKSEVVDEEFQRVLENLQTEIRQRAFEKGATGVIRFKTEVTPLSVQSHYRIIASGVAIRPDNLNPFEATEPPASDAEQDPLDPLLGEPGIT
jgi:hypothetical protein